MITASMVKELREKTGAGMMECKNILVETNGDIKKAMELLNERGALKAAKKSDRIAAEGMVATFLSSDKTKGAIVEVNAETDFVGKNKNFVKFVNDLALHIANNESESLEKLLEEKFQDTGKTVKEVLNEMIATIGENMTIRRFKLFKSDNIIEEYVHGEGKIGVLLNIAKGNINAVKDICMQIAAISPKYLNRESVPAEIVKEEMDRLKEEVIKEGKPAAIAEKIVSGRINKFYSNICLVEQVFIKDDSKTVLDILKENDMEIIDFVRFEKGEGIEKKEENFAEEVMNQLK